MDRRRFLKNMGLLGMAGMPLLGSRWMELQAATADQLPLDFVAVPTTPQVINIFLYGGPSELAGNMTNFTEIMEKSQVKYEQNNFDPISNTALITPNKFWAAAGGNIMEEMLLAGDMSIYRTLNRTPEHDTKGHGNCVTTNLLGNADESSPGIATTLAWIINQQAGGNLTLPNGKASVNELLFPIVSFEGESTVFRQGELAIPIGLKALALNSNLQNPYQRSDYDVAQASTNYLRYAYLANGGTVDTALENLASSSANSQSVSKIKQAMASRAETAFELGNLLSPANIDTSIANYNLDASMALTPIDYTDGGANFGARMKAAVSLALANPDTMFISMGSGGLGGWDDHSEALIDYPTRMNQLMGAIRAGLRHIKAARNIDGLVRADNIIINVYGDFGRNVNLNNSKGWDHGNNQNFYTFGGSAVRPAGALGNIVGTTSVLDPGNGRYFTTPAAGSPQWEPFAIASNIYRYFGVTNPELLTGVAAMNEGSVETVSIV